MKTFNKIFLVFLVLITFITLVSCNINGGDSGCNHSYELKSYTRATCTEPGEIIEECTLCNDIKISTTSSTGHNEVGGYCSKCGNKID